MGKTYVLNVVRDGSKFNFAEAHFVAYNPPKLVLRLSVKDLDKLSALRSHAEQCTELPFQLEWQGSDAGKDNQVWESPKFRAQVTSADQPPLHFELTLLDSVDLSGLE
jgi:hypothetical protein